MACSWHVSSDEQLLQLHHIAPETMVLYRQGLRVSGGGASCGRHERELRLSVTVGQISSLSIYVGHRTVPSHPDALNPRAPARWRSRWAPGECRQMCCDAHLVAGVGNDEVALLGVDGGVLGGSAAGGLHPQRKPAHPQGAEDEEHRRPPQAADQGVMKGISLDRHPEDCEA